MEVLNGVPGSPSPWGTTSWCLSSRGDSAAAVSVPAWVALWYPTKACNVMVGVKREKVQTDDDVDGWTIGGRERLDKGRERTCCTAAVGPDRRDHACQWRAVGWFAVDWDGSVIGSSGKKLLLILSRFNVSRGLVNKIGLRFEIIQRLKKFVDSPF